MHRVILDTDGGVDDALAILYLLNSPGVRIDAITTVHGNVPVEAATRNVFEILRIAGHKVPVDVARGCDRPLRGDAVAASHVHGDDGLGGWTKGREVGMGKLATNPAHQVILDCARRCPGEVTLITIGPLTNAAAAFRGNPEGFRLLKDIVVMGGAVSAPGNVTAAAEFNIYADPEAAREVLRSGVPVTIAGLNVTMQVGITRERLEQELGERDDERAGFLRCICGQIFSFYRAHTSEDICYLHDPLAVGAALDPAFVRTRRLPVDVETKGELTRGMTVADLRRGAKTKGTVDVCVEADAEAFIDEFCRRVLRKL